MQATARAPIQTLQLLPLEKGERAWLSDKLAWLNRQPVADEAGVYGSWGKHSGQWGREAALATIVGECSSAATVCEGCGVGGDFAIVGIAGAGKPAISSAN